MRSYLLKGNRLFTGTILFFGFFLGDAVWAIEPRDCDGYIVTDTTVVVPELKARLDSASNGELIDISLQFWAKFPEWVPDSCLRTSYCPDMKSDSILGMWQKWRDRLFTDYQLFQEGDTALPLSPDRMAVSVVYNNLLARKTTVLALSKECYIYALWLYFPVPVSIVGHESQLRWIEYGSTKRHFDALGRSWRDPRVPWRPMARPPFESK